LCYRLIVDLGALRTQTNRCPICRHGTPAAFFAEKLKAFPPLFGSFHGPYLFLHFMNFFSYYCCLVLTCSNHSDSLVCFYYPFVSVIFLLSKLATGANFKWLFVMHHNCSGYHISLYSGGFFAEAGDAGEPQRGILEGIVN
jgi:hypothetical protein